MRVVLNQDWSVRQEHIGSSISEPAQFQSLQARHASTEVLRDADCTHTRRRRLSQKQTGRLSSHSHQVMHVRSRLLSQRQDEGLSSVAGATPHISSSDSATAELESAVSNMISATIASGDAISSSYSLVDSRVPSSTVRTSTDEPMTTSRSVSAYSASSSSLMDFSTSSPVRPRSTSGPSSTRPYTSFTFRPNGTATVPPGSRGTATSSTTEPYAPLISLILSIASAEGTSSYRSNATAISNSRSVVTVISSMTILPVAVSVEPPIIPTAASSSPTSSSVETSSTYFAGPLYTVGNLGGKTTSPPLTTHASQTLSLPSSQTLTVSSSTSNTSPAASSIVDTSSSLMTSFATSSSISTRTSATSSAMTTGTPAGVITSPTSDAHQTTKTVVGGVVGGLAGLSAIVVVLYFLWRLWRKHAPGAFTSGNDTSVTTARPAISFRAGSSLLPVTAAGGLLGGLSAGRAGTPPIAGAAAGERSFQRMSGRKLPSQWSSGMEGPRGAFSPAAAASATRGMQQSAISGSTAFHRPPTAENPFLDPPGSYGTIGGFGVNTGAGTVAVAAGVGRNDNRYEPRSASPRDGALEDRETLMPSPARTPQMRSTEPRTSHLATPVLQSGSMFSTPSRPTTTSTVRMSGTRFREDL